MKAVTWFLAATVLLAGPALAATPKDTVVMAKQIDDIISLDPAESFEFSGSEVVGNIYERLIAYDLKAPATRSRPRMRPTPSSGR